ncbi:hypothetical protein [Oceanirhabdus sp. W0125-5]|uniref:hypothetical protein n=1 Tax=Oceanirhabdus sp. W0125-5 TaxID=2999116 RepID=UPI0022F2E595|nr:hypothetical protein [Oceanirhabdus sp. W0125-5]WBW98841.1 hypothetical protein OW730_08895 [Oceanirhabdus sp. W0125-5]
MLHNIGNAWCDKKKSPLISASSSFETACEFSNPTNIEKTSIVIAEYGYEDSPYFIRTEKLNEILKNFGVEWYEDIHKEIMMLDGIYTHYILGIFDIRDMGDYDFIMNPWLYEQFKKDIDIDLKKGINVEQTDFEEIAKKIGYKKVNYFRSDESNGRIIKELQSKKISKGGCF